MIIFIENGIHEQINQSKILIENKEKEYAEIFRRVDEIDPQKISVDPTRFQYKILGALTRTGEVGSLAGIQRFNPDLAGILQVWRDPDDKKIYVVNGHNRLALAQRANTDKIAVRFLEAGTAQEARSIGALTNIAEGRGTALDAAKFFRDTGLKEKDLKEQGIQIRDTTAKEGIALASLPKVLFNQVIDGDLEKDWAVEIGKTGFDEQKQYRLYEMIKAQENKRKITSELIGELSAMITTSTTNKKQEEDLFGKIETEEDYYFERANLTSQVKHRLSKEKRIFGVAGRGEAALKKAGNIIDVEKTLDIAHQASQFLELFEDFKNLQGPVADILNAGAKQIKEARNNADRKKVEDAIYSKIYEAIPSVMKNLGVS